MKSSILAAATFALLMLPALAEAQAAVTTPGVGNGLNVSSVETGPVFTKNLSQGSAGDDVLRLQRYLNTHGCPIALEGPGSYLHETSYFGPATKKSLQCFQKDTGLITATGNLGPLTRQYISTLP